MLERGVSTEDVFYIHLHGSQTVVQVPLLVLRMSLVVNWTVTWSYIDNWFMPIPILAPSASELKQNGFGKYFEKSCGNWSGLVHQKFEFSYLGAETNLRPQCTRRRSNECREPSLLEPHTRTEVRCVFTSQWSLLNPSGQHQDTGWHMSIKIEFPSSLGDQMWKLFKLIHYLKDKEDWEWWCSG